MQTVDQFAEALKAKYPDYQDIPNGDLVARVVKKYPQYESQIDASGVYGQIGEQLSAKIAPKAGENAAISMLKGAGQRLIKSGAESLQAGEQQRQQVASQPVEAPASEEVPVVAEEEEGSYAPSEIDTENVTPESQAFNKAAKERMTSDLAVAKGFGKEALSSLNTITQANPFEWGQRMMGADMSKKDELNKKTEDFLKPTGKEEELGATIENVAEFFAPGAIGSKVKGVKWLAKLPKYMQYLLPAATESAATLGTSARQEGEITRGGVVASAIPFAATGIKAAKNAFTGMRKALSMAPEDINAVQKVLQTNIAPEEAAGIVAAAKTAAKDRQAVAGMEKVGETFKVAQDKVSALSDDAGKEIQAAAEMLKGKNAVKLDSKPARDALAERLEQLNVKIKKNGTLDFSNSDIASLKADQALVNDAWAYVKDGNPLDLRDTLSKIRNLRNQIYAGGADLTAGKGAVEAARTAMRESLYDVSGELADASKKFADAEAMQTALEKLTADGVRSPEFLRRVFSNAGSVPKDMLKQLDEFANKYGIEEGKNLLQKADFALAADNAAGVVRTTSLKGQIAQAITNPRQAILSKVGDLIVGNPMDHLEKMLATAGTPEEKRKILGDILKAAASWYASSGSED